MAKWAVFDFDGTLLPGDSFEKRFIWHLIRRGMLSVQKCFFYGTAAAGKILKGQFEEAFKSNKYYLKDFPVNQIREEAERFFHSEIQSSLSSMGIRRVSGYRRAGFRIMLFSGTPDLLEAPLQELFQPDFLLCARLRRRNGRVTGEIDGLHPYGEAKATILQNLAGKIHLDFDHSIVFANHHSDIPHMQLFDQAIAVNPTPKLEKHARKSGWKIEIWQ